MAVPAKKKGEPALGLLIGMTEPKGKAKSGEEDLGEEEEDGSDEAFDVAAEELFGDDAAKKDALKRAVQACMKGY